LDWDLPEVQDVTLTMLVTDIRRSTEAFTECDPDTLRVFLYQFSNMTDQVLNEVAQGNSNYRISEFRGDGFLTFLSEPVPGDSRIAGPTRALLAGLSMRDRFRDLCRNADFRGSKLEETHLGIGIAYGKVQYGHLTGMAVVRTTGIGRDVMLACRLADTADNNQVLVSHEAAEHLQLADLRVQVTTITIPTSLKGFQELTTCVLCDWEDVQR
jgi:class 3 adenylate cyclase